jgi:aldose 1-epimerase
MGLITLQEDRLRLSIDPALGAGITDFSLSGAAKWWYPLMRRAAPGETNSSGLASFLLAPYSNRIANARFRFGGREVALKPTTPEGFTIHGDVRSRAFAILDRSPISARLKFDSRHAPNGDVNWPWPFACEVRYELDGPALVIDLSVTNLGDSPMPAGCGHHPYFPRRLLDDRDTLHLRCPVRTFYPLKNGIPTSNPNTTDPILAHLAELRPVRPGHFDGVLGGFAGRAELLWDKSRVRLTIDSSENLGHLVLFTPHESPDSDRPLPFVAVEPVTNVNDGFNRAAAGEAGTGVVTLAPGQSLSTTCRFTVSVE